jgi:hypothetical protein
MLFGRLLRERERGTGEQGNREEHYAKHDMTHVENN